MSHAITSSIDTAQIVLYTFWIFFFGLIVWLRREDRREGYPLEHELRMVEGPRTDVRIPRPKEFLLPGDEGVRLAPDFVRDKRPIAAERVAPSLGAPLEPTGEALLSGVGPASFAERSDHVENSDADGKPLIVPMRAAEGYRVFAGPDPRGWNVVGADRAVAGVVSDIWVDRADLMVRYIEMELPGEGEGTRKRLIPITMLGLDEDHKRIDVRALRAEQFAHVPTTREPESITVLEEERVSAFYAGGWFYAEPGRREAVL